MMSKLIICIRFALFLGFALSLNTSHAAATGLFKIRSNINTNFCADIDVSIAKNGARVYLYSCGINNLNQVFNFTAAGEIRIHGKCLDASTARSEAQLQIQNCTGLAKQKFSFDEANAMIKGVNNLCIDIPRGIIANRSYLQMFTCDNSNRNQHFKLTSTGSPAPAPAPAPIPAPILVPTPAPTPVASTPVPSKLRSMWVWDDVDISPANRNELFDFAIRKGISVLYIHSAGLVTDRSRYPMLAEFINVAATRNISVELMFGDSAWTLTNNHYIVLNLVAKSNDFMNSYSGVKPKGLHFDIEPHTLPGWASDPVSLGNQLLDLYVKVREAASPALYINADIALGYRTVNITRGAVTKTLSQHLVDVTDVTTVMSYRDFALGDDSISYHADHPLMYAASKGKKTMVAVETECNLGLSKITFCEEGEAYFNSQLSILSNYYNNKPGFGGVAIHHYRRYQALIP